jgi:hypothetical protein
MVTPLFSVSRVVLLAHLVVGLALVHAAPPVIPGSAEWVRKVGADDPAQAGLTDPAHGAESNPTGEPIGGGTGYTRIVAREDATVVVRTPTGLVKALGEAKPGAVIYVADDAEIDLTSQNDISIPAGVTLASGRGRDGSEGGLLFTRTVKTVRLFRSGGAGIRLSGLRLEGSHPGRERLTQRPSLMGIYHPNVEVDNCEIFAWSCAALGVGSGASEGAWIHHNYIHHNQRAGLGYGVSLGRTHVLIEGNLFDFCRHAIASSGVPGSGYTARYNVHLENTISHVFDMHGARDFEKYMQVGLWHFDEKKGTFANDYSIYNGDHNGTLHNMADASWVEGHIQRALRFDGKDDYVDMGKQRQLSPKRALAVSAWIRPDAVEGIQAVFGKADTGRTGSGYSLRVVDGALEGVLYDPAGVRQEGRGGKIQPGVWQHVAMVWNGKQALLYVAGQQVGEFACVGRKVSGNHLLVGRDSATSTSFFRGAIDEARLYNRAMSATDVLRHAEGHGDIGGRLILMHHNTIRATTHAALTLRGRPSVGCWVTHNRFYAPERGNVVNQGNAIGNFHVSDNTYLGQGLRAAPDFSKSPLFGHWTFDKPGAAVPDASGRGRQGTIKGDAPAAAWVESPAGQAMRLVSGKRWVEIPKADSRNIPDRVSIGVRMRVDDLREHQVLFDNGFFRLFHRGGWARHRLYFMCRVNEDDRGGESSWSHFAGAMTLRSIKEGEWFEIVGERDGDTMRIYLDGMLESEVECLDGLTPSVGARATLRIGGEVDGAVDDFWIRSAARPGEDDQPKQTSSRLSLTGEKGYETVGVAPDSGNDTTQFRFRVLYRDPEGKAPAIGFPRVHIIRDGLRYLNEAPVTMLAVDGAPFDQGRLYSYTMRLPKGTEYKHFFEVETVAGTVSRTSAFAGPRVAEGSTAPVLSWTSQGGYSRDGVEPEIGDVSSVFDFRILFSDLDGDLPAEGQPRVHVLRGKKEIAGSPFAMTAMKDNPTWLGRAYRYLTKLPAGESYSYYFTARDAQGNEAPKSLSRRAPTVDSGGDIAPPDLSGIRVVALTSTTATIQWQSDEPASSRVEFGPTATYGKQLRDKAPLKSHSLAIKGLIPGTAYHYRVSSTDAALNQAQSGDYEFRTPAK